MFNFRNLIAAAAVTAASATAALAQTETLRFQNNSSYTVYRIYASPVTNSSWENDILGSNVLAPGRHLDATFRNVAVCDYDVLIQFEDGVEMTDVVNICQISQYNINN
jgi:hypothetical protein